jgi:hypothetical protein
MQLVRLALLTFGEPPGKLLGMTLASKAAQIGPLRRTVVDKTFLLESVTSLEHRPKKTGRGLIVIPEKPRISQSRIRDSRKNCPAAGMVSAPSCAEGRVRRFTARLGFLAIFRRKLCVAIVCSLSG